MMKAQKIHKSFKKSKTPRQKQNHHCRTPDFRYLERFSSLVIILITNWGSESFGSEEFDVLSKNVSKQPIISHDVEKRV